MSVILFYDKCHIMFDSIFFTSYNLFEPRRAVSPRRLP